MSDTLSSTAEKVATYDSMVDAYVAAADADRPTMLDHVQRAYIALPAATRGKAYPAALARAGAADPLSLAGLIAAHADLPASTASRVEKRQVTDAERAGIIDGLTAAIMCHDPSFLIGSEDDDWLREQWHAARDATVAYVTDRLNIGGGKRTTHGVDVTDNVPAGSDIVCQYSGTNTVGILGADGSVTIGDDVYPSLSKAAIAVTGQSTANGWVHWRYDGEKLATLRDRA